MKETEGMTATLPFADIILSPNEQFFSEKDAKNWHSEGECITSLKEECKNMHFSDVMHSYIIYIYTFRCYKIFILIIQSYKNLYII